MPIYEYQCSQCGKKYEVLQRWNDADLKRCKFCKGKVSKLISPTTFHLKGSGWYATDYTNKGKETAGSDKKTSSKNEKETVSESAAASDSPNSDSPKHNDAA
jgi:putative FmdB family regulatory protein